MEKQKSKYALRSWKLKDIILVSMMSVFFGVVYLSVDYLRMLITPLFDFFGLGRFVMEAIFGMWFIGNTLAIYIMRKPGIALVIGILSAAIQIPMGNPWGAIVVASGLMQGFGAELVFFIFRYKRYDWLTMLAAAAGCTVFSLILSWYNGEFTELRPAFLLAMSLFRLGSGLLFAGAASKLLADGLAKVGVLKSYPIGEKYVGNIEEP